MVPKDAEPEMREGHAYWPVWCGCLSPPKWVRGSKLLHGSTVSCGCQRADPGVRRLVRSGPGPEDHSDDALNALEAYYEMPDERPEYDSSAAVSTTPGAADMDLEGHPEEAPGRSLSAGCERRRLADGFNCGSHLRQTDATLRAQQFCRRVAFLPGKAQEEVLTANGLCLPSMVLSAGPDQLQRQNGTRTSDGGSHQLLVGAHQAQ
jgi:hypothetical protein